MRKVDERMEAKIVSLIKGGMSRRAVARRCGLSECTVSRIARRNGLVANNLWTEDEDALLREHYWELGATGMVKMLPRHPNRQCISKHAISMGLKTRVGPYGKLRSEDDKPPKGNRN